MLTIRMETPGSDSFIIVPADGNAWNTALQAGLRLGPKLAVHVDDLARRGLLLANQLAPMTYARGAMAPDVQRLQHYLQEESALDTDDPATPWELVSWRTGSETRFWGVEKPLVRVYGAPQQPAPDPDSGMHRSTLIVVSDPRRDLGLASTYRDKIGALILRSP